MPLSNHLTYRNELDAVRCDNPKCTEDHGPLWLHAMCHPKSALECFYQDGVLHVQCKKCHRPLTLLAIAREPESVTLSE